MPLAFRSLPSPVYLHEALWYKPMRGLFVWRERPREHFSTESAWKALNARDAGRQAGYAAPGGYRIIGINGTMFIASRIAWVMMTGQDPAPLEVDHINTDRSDDRWRNLRLATGGQNNANAKIRRDNTSGRKGIHRNGNGWMAEIQSNGIRYYLGTFPTPEAAHAAYIEAARRLHGAFAREG